jgi:flagellar capping protein FliD
MAGANDTMDVKVQEVRGQVDGLAADIRTMHERLDSTVTSMTARFNQLDLAQTATRNTLDTILARLDALIAKMESDYGGDTEQD